MKDYKRTYIGIDIGNSGAMSSLRDRSVGETIMMPTINLCGRKTADRYPILQFIENELNYADEVIVIIEKPSSHLQSQKVATSMWFGAMAVLCAIQDAGVKHQFIAAKKWQSEFSIAKDTKAMSISTCKSLFPEADLTATERSKKDNDNISDSILMAEYGRRKRI